MLNKFKALIIEEEGQGMAEYGLILGLIAVVVIGVIGLFGQKIKTLFTNLTTNTPDGSAAA